MLRIPLLILSVLLVHPVKGDITGTNPANGACLCFNNNAVNVRSSACGTVIGSANSGNCFKYTGAKQGCTLDKYYEFFRFDFGGREGWAAGTFIDLAADSRCSTSSEGYTCSISNQGRRVHETTSPTPYDCRDNGCGNSCQGGQCVALVTCSCTRNGQYAPGTNCWRPGTALKGADGKCNRAIPANTAIATFSGQSYYAGHAAIFVGCSDDYTIRVYDQWCCRNIGYSNYGSSHEYFSTFRVITNPGVCSDRASWSCRWENSGSTCCPTSVSGCLAHKYWWQSFI